MCINMLDQTVRVFAHFKEIRLLLCRLNLAPAVWAFSIHKLGLCKEGLARSAVHALVMPFINITLVVQLFENLLHLFFVFFVSSADKFVIGCIHQIPDSSDITCHIVHEFLRGDPSLVCLQLDFLTVFICTCLEEHIIPLASFVPCNRICKDDFIGVPNMRFAGCIGNRCCNVILLFF